MAFKRIKFRASNSQDNYYSEKKVKGMINHFEKKASQYLELLEYMKEQIKETGDIALTDPDSKIMKVKNNGRDICHNVQIAVDAKNRLVVAVDVTSDACDKAQLHNMASQAKEALGVEEL